MPRCIVTDLDRTLTGPDLVPDTRALVWPLAWAEIVNAIHAPHVTTSECATRQATAPSASTAKVSISAWTRT